MIARVTLELALRKEFDYLVPAGTRGPRRRGHPSPGPARRRKVLGCVTAVAEESAQAKLKPILKVIGAQALVTPKVLKLARWIGEYYCCAPETALKSRLAGGSAAGTSRLARTPVRARAAVPGNSRNLPRRQKEVWNIVEERRELPL